MELAMANGFTEMSQNEMMVVDGGGVWEAAIALVVAAGGAFVAGFQAGRQVVRDVKDKFFD